MFDSLLCLLSRGGLSSPDHQPHMGRHSVSPTLWAPTIRARPGVLQALKKEFQPPPRTPQPPFERTKESPRPARCLSAQLIGQRPQQLKGWQAAHCRGPGSAARGQQPRLDLPVGKSTGRSSLRQNSALGPKGVCLADAVVVAKHFN